MTTGKWTKVVGEECECYNKLFKVTVYETHCWPQGYFQLQYSRLRPSRCITVKPVMSSLCWPLCLTEGPLLHVPWGSLSAAVLKRALSSRLTTFAPRSEGLTVLLGLNEEGFALPWQKISHSPWQLWQLVMAACWWELCNPLLPPLPPLPSPAFRSSSSVLHVEHLKCQNLLFFFPPDYKNNKMEIWNTGISCCEREEERAGSTKAKHGAGWVTGRSWKAHKAI